MKFLSFIILLFCTSIPPYVHAEQITSPQIQKKLENLEQDLAGKIGIYALNTNNGQIINYRANERFPIQSTLKVLGVAALLKESEKKKNLLQEKLHYTKQDLIFWHPVTGKYVAQGMTFADLSAAAISYSDNPAMNLIMKKLGGPAFVTAFANSIGNKSFNVEHYEGDLNSNPADEHDTSTPEDMALSLQKLTLGNVLAPPQRAQLISWMKDNTTSYQRMRAGVPLGWVVADKTGAGEYGVNNDIGILWSPLCKPVVLAIYTVQKKPNAKGRDDIVVAATKIILSEFAKNDRCFNELNN